MKINPAYLAGVFDSDGSFTVSKRHIKRSKPNFTAMLQLTWKRSVDTESFMDNLVKEFGGSYAVCKNTNKKSFAGTKDYLKYSATGVAAQLIAEAILPFLVLKKEQAKNLLEVRFLTTSFTGPRPDHVGARLDELHILNRAMNEGAINA